jgi:hypothetical protein
MGDPTFFTGKMPVPRLKISISQLPCSEALARWSAGDLAGIPFSGCDALAIAIAARRKD